MDVTVVVKDEDGTEAFRSTETRSNIEMKASGGVYRTRTRIRLANVKPGRYILTVAAKYRSTATPTASRTIPFQVI